MSYTDRIRYIVVRTKDGRFAVKDKLGNQGIVATFDADSEMDAIFNADARNIDFNQEQREVLGKMEELKKELQPKKESLDQYMDGLIVENLRDWFKPHIDKRTGKRFKGWINCRTGGPCSSKSKGGKYPACRPTHQQCKKIKGKMHKKTSSKRVKWKD
jgi:hypothetical protein